MVLLGCFSFVRAPMANMADQGLKQQPFPSGHQRLQVWDQDTAGECLSEAPSWACRCHHLLCSHDCVHLCCPCCLPLLPHLSEEAVSVIATDDCLF